MKIDKLIQFKQWFLRFVINSKNRKTLYYPYNKFHFTWSDGYIKYPKEGEIYVRNEIRGLKMKFITYKLINNKWVELRDI